MNDGPADRDRFRSVFLSAADVILTSCLAQLFEREGSPLKVLTIFSVELVRDDLRFGGAGGTTGTKDLSVLGKAPNKSSGREMLVIG